MTSSTLHERLGGVFAIAAVIDHFSDAVVQTRSSVRNHRIPLSASGTRIISAGCQGSNSCGPCGCATLPVGPSSLQPRNQGALPSVWKKRIATLR